MPIQKLVVCLFVCAIPVLAQTASGTIAGLATDPAGAVAANTQAETRNLDIGIVNAAVATAAGNYIQRLPVGRYEHTVNAARVKRYNGMGLTLTAAQILRMTLEPLGVSPNDSYLSS